MYIIILYIYNYIIYIIIYIYYYYLHIYVCISFSLSISYIGRDSDRKDSQPHMVALIPKKGRRWFAGLGLLGFRVLGLGFGVPSGFGFRVQGFADGFASFDMRGGPAVGKCSLAHNPSPC